MNPNIAKTIEHISIPQTTGDLWDEFNNHNNPNSMMLYIPTDNNITVRILGPFAKMLRFYAPFLKYQSESQINIEAIADKNPEAIKKAKNFFTELMGKQGGRNGWRDTRIADIPTIIKYIDKIATNMTWQKCVMVNAYVKSGDSNGERRMKVLTMNRTLCDAIIRVTRGDLNIVLNGMFAHDLSITRRGEGIQTNFDVKLKPPTHLSETDMNIVFANGLIDIPSLITEVNKSQNSSYYYKKETDYRMPSEFTKMLIEEMRLTEEIKHLVDTEKRLNEIPYEAFERRNNMRDAIGSLEL